MQKRLPQTSHKIFSQCSIVNSSLLSAFIVQNFCKKSFSGGKSRKNGIPVIKVTFICKKSPNIICFHELMPKLLGILAGLILHSCVV